MTLGILKLKLKLLEKLIFRDLMIHQVHFQVLSTVAKAAFPEVLRSDF